MHGHGLHSHIGLNLCDSTPLLKMMCCLQGVGQSWNGSWILIVLCMVQFELLPCPHAPPPPRKNSPFAKIVILAKLLLCEISSNKVNKMRSPLDEKDVFAK